MTELHKAASQALEALENCGGLTKDDAIQRVAALHALHALHASLAEPVEEPVATVVKRQYEDGTYADNTADIWARVDKDGNVTHLDMDLCTKGPHNAYTALALAIWNAALEEAAKYAEGDGDDVLADSIRELKK